MTTASPQAVLAALREDLEPSPISKRLPTIIQLAAHLQLVGQRVAHEATILVGAFDQLRAQGVEVAPEQLNALMRLAARDNDELFDLSMDMRIEQLLGSLRKDRIAPVESLLSVYFPPISNVAEAQGNKHIYVRAMEAKHVQEMAIKRERILALVKSMKAEEKVKISAETTFNELGAKMLLAATRVVDDAEELMAMFPGLEGRRESLPAMRGAEHPRKRAPRRTMPARGVEIAGR